MSNFHQLKCDRVFFERTWRADKDFELRKDDRGYTVGDVLFICETDPCDKGIDPRGLRYTGRWIAARIIGIIRSSADAGSGPWMEPQAFHESLAKGYVALQLDDARLQDEGVFMPPGVRLAPARWHHAGNEGWAHWSQSSRPE